MSALLGLFKKRWLWLLLAFVLIALVIWWGGPYLALGDYQPLETVSARLIGILLIVVIWALKTALRAVKAARASGQLGRQVAAQQDPGAARASADAAQLQKRFAEAIQALGASRKGGVNLYELPWYIIIGPPGAGKTTAIVNSGLHFPLSEKFGKQALRGVGGTRNCDWWFTEQAILLDTAGRYTTQDSDQASDAAGWREFLALLRHYRRRRPINGVFVAMSLADLATQSEAERAAHVMAVQARLEELHRELRIELPVYLLLTKADLLAGFSEFFDDLSPEGRQQVWGATFPVDDSRAGIAEPQLARAFEELLDRLNERSFARMDAERDLQRRALIYAFPRQVASLRQPLLSFATEVFGTGAAQRGLWLRGVYFTSGTQEGTPIDRMMGALARTFGLSVRAVGTQSVRGRAYFLRRLLDVVFAESGLAGVNRRTELRHAMLQASAYLAIGAVAVLLLGWLLVSFGRNASYLKQVQAAVEPLAQLPTPAVGDLAAVLPRLDAYRVARDAASAYQQRTPLLMRAGLYQGNAVAGAADDAYLRELNTWLVPVLAHAFHDRLAQVADDPDKLYQYLEGYLMLVDTDHASRDELNILGSQEWKAEFPNDDTTVARLNAHLAALVQDPTRLRPVSADDATVDRARQSLRQARIPLLMLSRLKLAYAGDTQHAIHLDQEIGLGGDTLLVHKNGKPLTEPIPALYTRVVFFDVVNGGKEKVANDFISDSWVLGEGVASRADLVKLSLQLLDAYEADYIREWDGVLADLKLRRATSPADLAQMLTLLGSPTSPLKHLLMIIEDNTNLLKSDPNDKVGAAKRALAQGVQSVEQIIGSNGSSSKPGTTVTQHFASLHQLVNGAGGAAPIDQTLQAIGQLGQQLAGTGGGAGQTSAAAAVGSSAEASAVRQVQLAARQLPPPISAIVADLGSTGEIAVKRDASSELDRRYQSEVSGECDNLVAGRYPFANNDRDTALADFAQVFGPNGVFAKFQNDPLAPLIDTTGDVWRWRQGATGIGSAQLLAQFQSADRIRKIFFQEGGALPKISFTLTPDRLDLGLKRLVLDIDGTRLEYRYDAPRPTSFEWPGTSPGIASVLFEVGNGTGPNRSYQGPWALFRMLADANIQKQSDIRYLVTLSDPTGTYKARLILEASSVRNPFGRDELRGFRCGL